MQTLQEMALVITGAANGIGRAIAEYAIARGVRELLLTDVSSTGLHHVSESLGQSAQVEIVSADLKDPKAIDAVVRHAKARFGRIDGLVNSAGITTRASLLEGTPDIWDDVFSLNARAPFLLMQQAILDMRAREYPGAVVNIQSMNALCGHPDLAIYAASKGALQTLTKNAANAHMRDGIRVNGINLGWTLTETEHRMQAEALGHGPDWFQRAGAELPFGRLLSPEEAARLAVHLLDPASAPLTGACIDLEQWIAGAPP